MNLYFFMAGFWFVLGVALLVIPRFYPNALDLTFPGTNFSLAWFIFLLVLYNLARWNVMRASAKRRARAGSSRQHPPKAGEEGREKA